MNTKQLEYFLELSQTLNYRQASERLGATQPTLTKAMQHLERELGFALFSKQGRSIRLTGQAQAFIPYARECLDCLEQGVRAAGQGSACGRPGLQTQPSQGVGCGSPGQKTKKSEQKRIITA